MPGRIRNQGLIKLTKKSIKYSNFGIKQLIDCYIFNKEIGENFSQISKWHKRIEKSNR